MAISESDISLVLSGGSTNTNPNLALGGQPSANTVGMSINNLFSDVTSTESAAGAVDYRCLYLFNDGADPIYTIKLWVDAEIEGGSTIQIGASVQNESQRITISGATVTGGNFKISYKGAEFTSFYSSDLAVWALDLQNGLNSLVDTDSVPLLTQVQVLARNAGGTIIFDVVFAGIDGNRDHDLLVIEENNLTPGVTIAVQLLLQGGPINTIAPEIDQDTTPPGGVTFFGTSASSPITLPKLEPTEGFPFWIQRTTPSGTSSLDADGFSLAVTLETLNPLG